ncbi:MAG: serine protease [Flavobacteriales bacterium CG_4_9_14_3_um_filter_40_17]|nr:MAG: serine protease [Flavobacteriales bacterium CG_4_9_14_3_um_filter_40_17]
MEFFNHLEPLLKTFWFIAIPASIVFILQTVLTFVGADASDGADADFDSNLSGTDTPFQLFSFRNLINFLLGFGWTGISFYESITNKTILILISLLVGIMFVIVFFVIIKQIQKLAENNSFNIANTLGKTAEVYLTIPAKKSGKGKILISVNGSFHELDAITEKDEIKTGSMVRIIKVESGNLLEVETL